jgi:ATP-binding cassette subfamily C protein CydD
VEDLVRHADLFRVYGAGQRALAQVVAVGDRAGSSAASAEARRAALSGGNEVLGALSLLALVQLAPRAGWDIGTALLPFATVLFMSYRPLRDLGDARGWITRGEVALEALEAALGGLETESPAVPPLTSLSRSGAAPTVELSAYGARGRGPRVDMVVRPGEIVGLLGRTGAGKTTLLRALLGLEEEAGTLLVDGHPLGAAPAGPASRPFAWVPQDAPLVTGTLLENVALLGASGPRAREALEQVGASALLESLGEALIGPGGRPLSGGERRLVALARALASDQPVLLLDEPTEGLDPTATRTVLGAIGRLRGRRSVLLVSHRDEVMQLADRVVRLERAPLESAAAE